MLCSGVLLESSSRVHFWGSITMGESEQRRSQHTGAKILPLLQGTKSLVGRPLLRIEKLLSEVHREHSACSFGRWLMAGAGLF
jgi:hypothetical protein